MKTFFVLSFSLFLLNFLMPQEPQTGNITITVTSIENTKGQVRAALFDRAEGFPLENTNIIKAASAPTEKPKTVLVFKDVPYGEYAIVILHDENENGKIDSNVFGFPKEGYGVSNNNLSSFSVPKYEDARFMLEEPDKSILINLQN